MTNPSLPYDPDFDPPSAALVSSNPIHRGLWNVLSAKQAFVAGALTSLGSICAIGFFVLLAIMFNGNSVSTRTTSSGAPPLAGVPSPTAPTTIQLATITSKDWVRGNRSAKVAVVEFSDLECPFCKRFHSTMKQLMAAYPNDVQWVYRHFPLDSLHSKARKEAEATECAGELAGNDGFWKYIDRVFEITPSNNGLDPAQLPQIAQDIGLNRTKFQTCLDSGKYASTVQQSIDQAVAAGAQGTPYSVVVAGVEKIPVSGAVPYEQLKVVINSLVKK